MLTIWKETSFQGISPWGQQLGWLPALPVRRVLVMLLRAGTPWSTPSDFRRSMEKCLHMVTRVIFFLKCLYMSLENLSFFSDLCLSICWKCVQTVLFVLKHEISLTGDLLKKMEEAGRINSDSEDIIGLVKGFLLANRWVLTVHIRFSLPRCGLATCLIWARCQWISVLPCS
jgi:hypothetical protein